MIRAGVADRGLECVSRSLVVLLGNSGAGQIVRSGQAGQGSGNRLSRSGKGRRMPRDDDGWVKLVELGITITACALQSAPISRRPWYKRWTVDGDGRCRWTSKVVDVTTVDVGRDYDG